MAVTSHTSEEFEVTEATMPVLTFALKADFKTPIFFKARKEMQREDLGPKDGVRCYFLLKGPLPC